MNVKHISLAADLTGTLVTLFYEDGGKLSVTVPTPPRGTPITATHFIGAVADRLMLPYGAFRQAGDIVVAFNAAPKN